MAPGLAKAFNTFASNVSIMPAETVTTRLSKDEIEKLDWLAEHFRTSRSEILRRVIDEGLENILIEHVLRMYQKGEITLWRAAELADISISRMMEEARKRGIAHQYTVADLERDLKTLGIK